MWIIAARRWDLACWYQVSDYMKPLLIKLSIGTLTTPKTRHSRWPQTLYIGVVPCRSKINCTLLFVSDASTTAQLPSISFTLIRHIIAINNDNFKWMLYLACGQTHYHDEHAVVSSPGFPNNYSTRIECNYYIHSPPASLVRLTFVSFELDNYDDCAKHDYIQVMLMMFAKSFSGRRTYCRQMTR